MTTILTDMELTTIASEYFRTANNYLDYARSVEAAVLAKLPAGMKCHADGRMEAMVLESEARDRERTAFSEGVGFERSDLKDGMGLRPSWQQHCDRLYPTPKKSCPTCHQEIAK